LPQADQHQLLALDRQLLQIGIVRQPRGEFGQDLGRGRLRRAGALEECLAFQQQLRLAQPFRLAPAGLRARGELRLQRIGGGTAVVQQLGGGGGQGQQRGQQQDRKSVV